MVSVLEIHCLVLFPVWKHLEIVRLFKVIFLLMGHLHHYLCTVFLGAEWCIPRGRLVIACVLLQVVLTVKDITLRHVPKRQRSCSERQNGQLGRYVALFAPELLLDWKRNTTYMDIPRKAALPCNVHDKLRCYLCLKLSFMIPAVQCKVYSKVNRTCDACSLMGLTMQNSATNEYLVKSSMSFIPLATANRAYATWNA